MIEDVPAQVLDRSKEDIVPYVVHLMSVMHPRAESDELISPIGSGTLVAVSGQHFILTANHVITRTGFSRIDELGLAFHKQSHRFTIPRSELKVISIGSGSEESAGPDLAAIWLPGDRIGTLASIKSFWQLESHTAEALENTSDYGIGLWAVAGFPEEMACIIEADFSAGLSIHSGGLLGYSCIGAAFKKDQFDYLDLAVDYNTAKDVPESFAGVSGGGLWQVKLTHNRIGDIGYRSPMLSGVAFFQSDIENGKRFIRCHGIQSVYQVALKQLSEFVGG